MANFVDSEKYLTLIKLLSNYEKENSSFFASNEYTRLLEDTFKDLDTFKNLNDTFYQNSAISMDHLSKQFEIELDEIDKVNIVQYNAEYKKAKELNYEQYLKDIAKDNLEVVNKFKSIDQEFIPKTNDIKAIRVIDENAYQERLSNEKKDLDEGILNCKNKSKDLDDLNTSQVINKNNLLSLNQENYNVTLDSINQEFKDKHDEIEKEHQNNNLSLNSIIAKKENNIMENTVSLNEKITDYTDNINASREEKFRNFNQEEIMINDELKDLDNNQKEVSNGILNEFKNKLQNLDTEISELRELERVYDSEKENYLTNYIKNYNDETNTKLTELDLRIAKLRKQIAKSNDDNSEKELNKLVKERVNYANKRNKNLNKEAFNKQKEFLNGIHNYELSLDQLRFEKAKEEIFKNSAMLNVNIGQEVSFNYFNNKLKLIAKQKDFFTIKDQYEENVDVLKLRLDRDMQNSFTNYEIEVLNSQIKLNNDHLEFNLKTNQLEKEKEIELLNLQNDFQIESLNSNINLLNVTNLLEIQQIKIEEAYLNNLYQENISFIKDDFQFANQISDIQYELYTLANGYENHKLDRNISYLNEKKESYLTHINNLERYNILNNENIASSKINERTLTLYKDRFEIEEENIKDAFDLLHKQLSRINNFENYLLTNFAASSAESYAKVVNTVKKILSILDEYKIAVIEDFIKREQDIIESRISFSKELRYAKVKENIDLSHQNALTEANSKIEKLEETISNYKNTIVIFENNIKEMYLKIFSLNNQLRSSSPIEKEKINKEIASISEAIKNLRGKIKVNNINIIALTKSLKDLKTLVVKNQKSYETQVSQIARVEEKTAQIYANVSDAINHQLDRFKLMINLNSKKIERWGNYKNIIRDVNNVLIFNNVFIQNTRINHNHTVKLLNSAVNNELTHLSNNYNEAYERSLHHINLQISIENRNYNKALLKLNEDFKSDISMLTTNYNQERSSLLNHLKSLTNGIVKKERNHKNTLNNLKNKYDYDIYCNNQNINGYVSDNNAKISQLEKDYYHNVNEINKKYHLLFKVEKKNLDSLIKAHNQRCSNYVDKRKEIELELKDEFKEQVKHYKEKILKNYNDEKNNEKEFNLEQRNLVSSYNSNLKHNQIELRNSLNSSTKAYNAKNRESKIDLKRKIAKLKQ